MKRVIVLVCVLLLLAPAALAHEGAETLCLVTDLGRVNDGTFNQSAHEGAQLAADEYDLEYKFIETQAEPTTKPISRPALTKASRSSSPWVS